jgi:hypothetical protein
MFRSVDSSQTEYQKFYLVYYIKISSNPQSNSKYLKQWYQPSATVHYRVRSSVSLAPDDNAVIIIFFLVIPQTS